MSVPIPIAFALLITIAAETLVWRLLLPRAWGELLTASIAINTATVPLANLVYGLAIARGVHAWPGALSVEVSVVAVEIVLAAIVFGVSWSRAAALSLAANLSSALGSI